MTGSGGGGNNKWTEEQEWERKKAYQKAMQARGKGPDAKGLGNGALGVAGIGTYAQQQASRGAAAQPTYPSPSDLPKYNSLAEKQQAQKDAFNNIQQPGFGMGYSVKPTVAPAKPNGLLDQEVAAARGSNPQPSVEDIQPTYQEDASASGISKGDGGGKRPGLSIDNNAAVAQPLSAPMGGGSARGFGVSAPPRKAYGEDSRRQALAMDIKPYRNGDRLTTGQIALKNNIIMGNDEKYENERYTNQLNVAQKMAQESMSQSGANARAELAEQGSNTRASAQLGFDAEKFQQVSEQDNRKMDMQQSNDDVTNFLQKRLNNLYGQLDAATTPEDQSAIQAQINSLSNNKSKSQAPVVVSQTGESTDGMTTTKNPAMVYLPDTGEWVQTPARKMTQAEAVAIANDPDKSDEEKQQLLIAGGYGSDE